MRQPARSLGGAAVVAAAACAALGAHVHCAAVALVAAVRGPADAVAWRQSQANWAVGALMLRTVWQGDVLGEVASQEQVEHPALAENAPAPTDGYPAVLAPQVAPSAALPPPGVCHPGTRMSVDRSARHEGQGCRQQQARHPAAAAAPDSATAAARRDGHL